MKFKTILISGTTILGAAFASAQVPPGGYLLGKSPVIVGSDVKTINLGSQYCIENDARMNGAPALSQLQDIQISFKGESVTKSHGNTLHVRDRYGHPLMSSETELPYNPAYMNVLVAKTKNDICLSSEDLGTLKEMNISYRYGQSGTGPFPPQPPIHPPQPPFPPQPPTPPLPPQTDVRGQLVRVTQDGSVSGYACDRVSAADVDVVLLVNGIRTKTLRADQSAYNANEMGSPLSNGCDVHSGFKFDVNEEQYAGRTVRFEVLAVSPINKSETLIGSSTIEFPVLRLPEGVFNVGQAIYLSEGPTGTYCHIGTMDLVRILKQYYPAQQRSLNAPPILMHNRGECEVRNVKEGFFQKMSGSEIYYSNGKDAFCHVPTMDMVGNNPYPRLLDQLPTNMRNDCVCGVGCK